MTSDSAIAGEVPRTESDRHALVFAQPRGWEYALYGSVLRDHLAFYEPQFRDWRIGYVAEVGPRAQGAAILELLADFQTRSLKLVENFNGLMDAPAQERAFGEIGQPGDPALIEHLARRLIDVYGSFLDAVARLRSARYDEVAARAVNASADMNAQPICAIREFVAGVVDSVDSGLRTLREKPDEMVHLTQVLTLHIPDAVVEEATESLRELSEALQSDLSR